MCYSPPEYTSSSRNTGSTWRVVSRMRSNVCRSGRLGRSSDRKKMYCWGCSITTRSLRWCRGRWEGSILNSRRVYRGFWRRRRGRTNLACNVPTIFSSTWPCISIRANWLEYQRACRSLLFHTARLQPKPTLWWSNLWVYCYQRVGRGPTSSNFCNGRSNISR